MDVMKRGKKNKKLNKTGKKNEREKGETFRHLEASDVKRRR